MRPQCPTTTSLEAEEHLPTNLASAHQEDTGAETVGIEKLGSANCVHNNHKTVKRVLNGSIILLEFVMDTHCTLQNLTNTQAKPKSSMPSVECMLLTK